MRKKPRNSLTSQEQIKKVGSATEFLVGMFVGLGLAVLIFVLKNMDSSPEISKIKKWIEEKFPWILEL